MATKITPIKKQSNPSTRPEILLAFSNGAIDVFQAALALDKASSAHGGTRKLAGVVYTPKAIAARMCALANPKLSHKVIEPSCGRGVFIFALAEHHLAQGINPDACNASLSQNLLACEIDPDALADLTELWELYWASKGASHPAPLRALLGDSLFGAHPLESFDLTLGNPPYVRFQNLDPAYRQRLQKGFDSCAHGNVDLYFAFVERALKQSKRCCLIVPNSWLASHSGKALRDMLRPKIERLIDFGQELVFAPVRAYACIALAHGLDLTTPMLVQTAPSHANSDPWRSLPRSDERIARGNAWRLNDLPSSSPACRKLADIATIQSGIATLADKSYAIFGGFLDGAQMEFFDESCAKKLRFDLAIAPKLIKLTKVKSEKDIQAIADRILMPYDSSGSLISEANLAINHPDALAFLQARKNRLAERDKGKQSQYESWHAYGRKQGLAPLPAGALIALPIMGNNALAPFEFNSATTGRFLFTSGFILAPKAGHTAQDILKALQGDKAWAFILSRGKPWAGPEGSHYRSYGARLLAELPID